MLRTDLKIVTTPGKNGCVLVDEKTGEEYEFGEIEHWLIEGIRSKKTAKALCLECNTRFSLQYRIEDIHEFFALLSTWGLMTKSADKQNLRRHAEEKKVGRQEVPCSGTSEQAEKLSIKPDDSRSLSLTQEDVSSSGQTTLDEAFTTQTDFQRNGYWHLFDPSAGFDALSNLSYLSRLLAWLTPLAFAIGTACVISRPDVFVADLGRAYTRFGVFGRILFAALSVNLASQIARGAVARRFGIETPSFGITLAFGLIPRFNTHLSLAGQPDRKTRLWLNSTATLVRLWFFALGTVSWAILRQGGSNLAVAGAELALIAIIGLFFVANPLWNGDGSRFLSALFDLPDLHRQSQSALRSLFIKMPVAVARHQRHSTLFALFGVASMAMIASFAAFVAYRIFSYLEHNHHGAGVALFILLGFYVSLRLRRFWTSTSNVKGEASNTGPPASVIQGGYRLKAIVLLALAIAALLPYRYEMGGDAEVLPLVRATISPEMDGVIEEIFVSSGQQVKAGTVLARMADYQFVNEIEIIEADIAAKQNEILRFQTTPSNAEIKLAEEHVNTARIQYTYTESRLQRQQTLIERGFVSQQSYEDIRRDLDRDRQLLAEAVSNLAAVKDQINPFQIAQLRDELQKLVRRANAYRDQLKHTRLTAPFDGRVVTGDLQYQRNSYFEAGKVLAEIENTSMVFVRIAVPEYDYVDILPGASVRVRLWAFPQREFIGTVEEIESTAVDKTYGTIINVKSRFSNEQMLLKSGLTGFAKVEGEETVLVLAFTRALLRFAMVEMWSWLP